MNNKKLNVFVFGSCVSRDPFEMADEFYLNLIRYFARSSFASFCGEPKLDIQILDCIESRWQRKMVQSDMAKSVLAELLVLKEKVDVILIDLIDERFGVHALDEEIVTVSNEYKKSASIAGRELKVLGPYSQEKMNLWVAGVDRFFLNIKESGLVERVYINEIYYSNRVDFYENEVDKIGIWDLNRINKANEFLSSMYKYLEKYVSLDRFIKYPDSVLVVDGNHKWGVSPFHFVPEMGRFQNSYLNKINR